MSRPTRHESDALLAHGAQEGYWFRAKEDIVQGFLRGHVGDDSSVVVLAPGNGATVRRLRRLAPRCSVVGIDVDPAAVSASAAQDPAGAYRVADLEEDLIAEPASVDVVVALDVLEHLEDDDGVVRRVAEVLKPGGRLFVNVPAHPWLYGDHDVRLGHVRRYRPAEVEALVERQGLRIAHSTPLFLTTLVLLVAWRRVVQPLLGVRPNTSDVGVRLPRPLDGFLYAISRIEGWVARLQLPLGSSHFVVAQRPCDPTVHGPAIAPAAEGADP